LQVGLFFAQTVRRLASRGAVQTLVSHFRLPAPDFGIGGDDVEAPSGLLEPGYQGNVEGAAQVAVEPFDLALGSRTVRAAQFDDEAAVFGRVEKSCVIAVLSRTIDIALQDDGLHVVEQQAFGNAAQRGKSLLMAVDQGSHFHVADKLDVAGPTVAQGRAEGVERIAPFAKLDPVHLHLFARIGFEPDHGIGRHRRSKPEQMGAQRAHSPNVTVLDNLSLENGGRNPVRMRRRLPFAQVVGVRGELARALLLTLIAWGHSRCQMAAYRVYRTAYFGRYPPQTESVLPQNLNVHIRLVCNQWRL